ncbi:MAG: methyltransferase [Methanoculleus sp. SDB]|nr:MAG: methyltransferase [Methanoculleus sp. SDB]
MRARCVSIDDLDGIAGEPWVDRSRRPYVDGKRAFIPVKDGFSAETELPERMPYRGRGYQMVGDIALIHGDLPTPADLNALVGWARPRGVIHVGGYAGPMRIPVCTRLRGTGGVVRHRESGCTFVLDPERVMFAQGNREEKARMASVSGKSERIADMFAGIGYFTVPCARAGAQVHAMELNPEAFFYLRQNIIENDVQGRVRAECGDCRDLLRGFYTRVIMGHFDSPSMMTDALAHTGPGSTLHVHGTSPAEPAIRRAVREAGFAAVITERRVKKYAPGRWHKVWDVVLG